VAVSEIVTFFIEHRILLAGVLGVFLALLFFWLKITQFIFKFQENQSQEIINTIHIMSDETADIREEMRQLKSRLELVTSLYKASVDQRTKDRLRSKRPPTNQDK
jgi:hypothetical protein